MKFISPTFSLYNLNLHYSGFCGEVVNEVKVVSVARGLMRPHCPLAAHHALMHKVCLKYYSSWGFRSHAFLLQGPPGFPLF